MNVEPPRDPGHHGPMPVPTLIPVASMNVLTAWEHFRFLLLTDEQLRKVLEARWPDLEFTFTKMAGVDCWDGKPFPEQDVVVFRVTEKNRRMSLAIRIQGGRTWLSYRFGLYCLYVFHLSGGSS